MKDITGKLLKALLFCATVTLFLSSNTASAKKIAIDKKNFSHEMITYVIPEFDKDEDGYLSDKEIKKADSIELSACDGRWPFDFKGIEKLTNLKKIQCIYINFENFDYNILKNIRELTLSCCKIDRLDFEKMPQLEKCNLWEVDTNSSYNFKKNTKLKSLSINNCKVKNVDIAYLEKLEELCIGENIPKCDISKTPNIKIFTLRAKWDKVDISCLNNLEELEIGKGVPKFDLSKNKKLKKFILKSKWDKLDISKNKKLKDITIVNSKIKKIDLRNQKQLEGLKVNAGKCESIKLPLAKKLKFLTIKAPVSDIDNSKIPNVEVLEIAAQLSEIQFDNNNKLEFLKIDAPITALDISGLTSLRSLTLKNCPITVFDFVNSNLEYLRIYKCDFTEMDITGLPKLQNIYGGKVKLSKFTASESNTLLDNIEFMECKELESITIKDVNKLFVVTYYTKENDEYQKRELEELWNPETGQIEFPERIRLLVMW